ncbi:MAG: WG repeat-containing protein, partial [Azoarcus sp.]|nr:WG repeat-containing protein [Azoarcus sp.]
YINEKGEEVIPLRFDGTFDFDTNGLAMVLENREVAWINRNGQVVVKLASVCGAEVLLNANGDIIWPRATATQICEDAKQRSAAVE